MKLSRISFFFSGIFLLLIIYTAERVRFVIGSEKITAKFVKYIEEPVGQERVVFPILEYTRKSKYTGTDTVYQFRAKEDTKYEEGETVPVLLIGRDPDWPKLYSLGSFWLFPIVYYILPVLLWSSFCFSFIGRKEKIVFRFRRPFIKREK